MVNLVETWRKTLHFPRSGSAALSLLRAICRGKLNDSLRKPFETFTIFINLLTGFSRNEH